MGCSRGGHAGSFGLCLATGGRRQVAAASEGDIVGDVTVVAFGILTLVGLVLVGFGALRRARIPLVIGGALLLALAGTWMFGLPGAAVGVVALGFLKSGRMP